MSRIVSIWLLVSVGCASNAQTTPFTLQHGGRERRYFVHAPAPVGGSAEAKLPLVVVYHGGGGHAANAERMTGFSALADREGFVVAYPDGTAGRFTERLLTWNSAGIPVWAVQNAIDDVGFTRAMVEALVRSHRVDPARVYATGMSNGGMMVHRLAREAADVFAAVCDVAGAMGYQASEPTRGIGVMMVHGRADEHVRFEGGRPAKAKGDWGDRDDPSVDFGIAYYVAHNRLASTPERTINGPVAIDRYARTATGEPAKFEVVRVAIDGEGHTWPGGERGSVMADHPTQAYDASRGAWEFFARHRRE